MVLKNLINGLDHINMWGIGRIIRKMDLEYSIIRMVISMREDGLIIKGMVKGHFGCVIPRINLEESTLAIGKTIRKKEEELCFLRQATDMMECGWIANLMVKVE
jgi:hypothetical protein